MKNSRWVKAAILGLSAALGALGYDQYQEVLTVLGAALGLW